MTSSSTQTEGGTRTSSFNRSERKALNRRSRAESPFCSCDVSGSVQNVQYRHGLRHGPILLQHFPRLVKAVLFHQRNTARNTDHRVGVGIKPLDGTSDDRSRKGVTDGTIAKFDVKDQFLHRFLAVGEKVSADARLRLPKSRTIQTGKSGRTVGAKRTADRSFSEKGAFAAVEARIKTLAAKMTARRKKRREKIIPKAVVRLLFFRFSVVVGHSCSLRFLFCFEFFLKNPRPLFCGRGKCFY